MPKVRLQEIDKYKEKENFEKIKPNLKKPAKEEVVSLKD